MAGNAVIGALRVTLGLDSAQFEDGLKSAQGNLGKFGGTLGKTLNTLSNSVEIFTGKFIDGIAKALDAADEMGKAAQKFGVPIEQLSALGYAADLAGVSMDGLGTGLRKLAQNMDDAATGGMSRGAEAFQRLGIAVRNADGSMRSQSEVLADVAAKFEKMPDGAQKTAMAMAMFGKSGADLIPLLNQGRDGLAEMTAEAAKLGQIISRETAVSAENFNDNLRRLKLAQEGVYLQITASLAPSLEYLSKELVDAATSGDRMAASVDAIKNSVINLTSFFATAGVDIANFASETAAYWEVIKSPFNMEKWNALDQTLKANAERLEAVKNALEGARNALPNASSGLGNEFGKAGTWTGPKPQNDNLGFVPGAVDEERLAREREMMDDRITRFRESLLTEEEEEFASFNRRLEQLAEFEAARGGQLADSAELRAGIEAEYNERMARMSEQRLNDFASTIGSVNSILGSLTTIMGKEGDKQLGIMKALSLAEGLINVYTGITAALRLPFPANMAAAAAVAAQGFSVLASMRSTGKGSSSGSYGGRGGGGGSEAAAAAPAATAGPNAGQSLHVSFRGNFTGESAESIAKKLVDYQRDGGTVIFNKAA